MAPFTFRGLCPIFTTVQTNRMTSNDLQAIITVRLEQMATQVEFLYANGYHEEAAVLRAEGLELAAAYDDEEEFLVLGDFTTI